MTTRSVLSPHTAGRQHVENSAAITKPVSVSHKRRLQLSGSPRKTAKTIQCIFLVSLSLFTATVNVNGQANDSEPKFSKLQFHKILRAVPILYDSTGYDSEYQLELLTSVKIALQDLNSNKVGAEHYYYTHEQPRLDIQIVPYFIDVGQVNNNLLAVAKSKLFQNKSDQTPTIIAVSLLAPEILAKFVNIFQNPKYKSNSKSFNNKESPPFLKIISPRISAELTENENQGYLKSGTVQILSMQMRQEALCTALLHRVREVGVVSLIPILDADDNSGQTKLLQNCITSSNMRQPETNGNSTNEIQIQFTAPIYVKNVKDFTENSELVNLFDGGTILGSGSGILLLAKMTSLTVLNIASERKNLFQMHWFSPHLIEYEEWALGRGKGAGQSYGQPISGSNNSYEKSAAAVPSTFGIYSVHFVGGKNWDNPSRRKTLRDLHYNIGASPRILSSILAYDATWVAINLLKNQNKLTLPMHGLSGEIDFDESGHRREGVFYGVSAAPKLNLNFVALLQPSEWILEDVVNIVENVSAVQRTQAQEPKYLITDYSIATSSILTKNELIQLRSSQGQGLRGQGQARGQALNDSVCDEHMMEIISHDPFSQMSMEYKFKDVENLPENIIIPNQHGFGISFMCKQKGDGSVTTMKIACTQARRFSNDPIKCFRSHLQRRPHQETEAPSKTRNKRETYYYHDNQHRRYSDYDSLYYANRRDDSYIDNTIDNYNNPLYSDSGKIQNNYENTENQYHYYSTPAESYMTPASTSVAVGDTGEKETSGFIKIYRKMKPFIGNCAGTATGCALCVLFLGRFNLGLRPPVCIGSCAIGISSACQSLIGKYVMETTVICTELFRQGYLDTHTFFADAEFGQSINKSSPTTLKGYQLLATPLVGWMRESKEVTEFVATFALPWANYMKYKMGYSNEFNLVGYLVNLFGSPVCFTVGFLHTSFNSWREIWYEQVDGNSTIIPMVLLLVAFLSLCVFDFLKIRKQK